MIRRCASGLLLAAAMLTSCSGGTGDSPDGLVSQPNILFISVDDLNDWIEPLGGHPQAITPNLSRLAGRGDGLHPGLHAVTVM